MSGSANASIAFRPNFATIATFEEAAPRYDSSGAQLAGPIADRLVSLAGLRPGDQVLDAGCGAGAVTIRSANAVSPGGQVIGLDLADGMLRRTAAEAARCGLDNVTVRRGTRPGRPSPRAASMPCWPAWCWTCCRTRGPPCAAGERSSGPAAPWRSPGVSARIRGGRRSSPRWTPTSSGLTGSGPASAAGISRRDDRHAGRARVHRHPDVFAYRAGAVHRARAVVAGLVGGGPWAGLAAHPGRRPGRRPPRGLRPAGTDARTRRRPGPPGRDGVRGRVPAGRGRHRERPCPRRAPPRQFPARTGRRASEARQRATGRRPPGLAAGFTAPPARAARPAGRPTAPRRCPRCGARWVASSPPCGTGPA